MRFTEIFAALRRVAPLLVALTLLPMPFSDRKIGLQPLIRRTLRTKEV